MMAAMGGTIIQHEKTHSRPWKCPLPTCKYHEYGWPTEKEKNRHINDKHTPALRMYECKYKPCPYKSNRESNCRQHMEKDHGWINPKTTISQSPEATNSHSPNPLPRPGRNTIGFRNLEYKTISRDNTADEDARRSASFAYLGSKLTSCSNRSLKLKSVQTEAPMRIRTYIRNRPFLCKYYGCERAKPGNGFPRQGNLDDHLRRVHSENNSRLISPRTVSEEMDLRNMVTLLFQLLSYRRISTYDADQEAIHSQRRVRRLLSPLAYRLPCL
ncbi:hypothetical protein F4678DRAFT_176787 [Xylaria arbuscula]|nr:hypothetical protein F4678DRAFT_176787 [Xylaria arbuscula]